MKKELPVQNPLHCWVPIVPAISSHLGLTHSEAVALGIIYENSKNKFGQCFFYSHKFMAEMLALTITHTRRIIKKMEEEGYFSFIDKHTLELSPDIKALYLTAEKNDDDAK